MTERNDSDRRQATPAEGVRILGAEEAQAALENRDRRGERSAPAEPAAAEPAVDPSDPDRAVADRRERFPRFPGEGPTWSAADAGFDEAGAGHPGVEEGPVSADDAPTGEIPPLPHWTEPPTGAVPAIFADDSSDAVSDDDDLDAWSVIGSSQPRFRAEGSDWAEADFVEEELVDEAVKIGALAESAPVDEDLAFAEEFEQRRRRTPRGRAPRTMVTTPPAAPSAQPISLCKRFMCASVGRGCRPRCSVRVAPTPPPAGGLAPDAYSLVWLTPGVRARACSL